MRPFDRQVALAAVMPVLALREHVTNMLGVLVANSRCVGQEERPTPPLSFPIPIHACSILATVANIWVTWQGIVAAYPASPGPLGKHPDGSVLTRMRLALRTSLH